MKSVDWAEAAKNMSGVSTTIDSPTAVRIGILPKARHPKQKRTAEYVIDKRKSVSDGLNKFDVKIGHK